MSDYLSEKNIEARCARWLDLVRPYNKEHLALAAEKAALLVIDMQRYFLNPDKSLGLPAGLAVLPNVRSLVGAFRKSGRPVIFTRHIHHPDRIDAGILGWWWQDMIVEGTPESEIHDDLRPGKSEKVVQKSRYSAFYNTDLDTVLRVLKIEDIVITGVMTNLCCESTARDAYFRDFRVFFTADGTATMTEEMHQASLLNLAFGFARITTTRELLAWLSAPGRPCKDGAPPG
jgi:nicotinamidase-related amidase